MLKISQVYRNTNEADYTKQIIDGLPNYKYETYIPFRKKQLVFERGMFKPENVIAENGDERIPLIIISSSPHKAGTLWTPWSDDYDPDNGTVTYFGDNKTPGMNPLDQKLMNSTLVELLDVYNSQNENERAEHAVPVLFFERVKVGKRIKGNLMFHGVGILEKAERVTQNTCNNEHFANYKFTFCVLSLDKENDCLDWNWILDRFNPSLSNKEANRNAPASWKTWVRYGSDYLRLVRRNKPVHVILNPRDQLPIENSKESDLLKNIYSYYSEFARDDFGWLGIEVTRRVLESNGFTCQDSGRIIHQNDRRSDFTLHMNAGKEPLTGLDLRVLGQADCTDPYREAEQYDISKGTSELKGGLIGSLVTTSYFSRETQKKVQEQRSPVILINGLTIARTVGEELTRTNLPLDQYLISINGARQ